jgi:putative oxidoreductase
VRSHAYRGTVILVRMLLSGVFMVAGVTKIINPRRIADDIAAYHILPRYFTELLALGLPIVEIVCSIAIISGVLMRSAILAVIMALTAFIGATGYALVHHLPISCGCFGSSPWLEAGPWSALGRDVALLGFAVTAYMISLRNTGGLLDPLKSKAQKKKFK